MTDFEKELIHYIFHVQDADDDNLSAEVICRKLYKYGLIDRGRGYWRPKKRPKYRWPVRMIRKAEQTEPKHFDKPSKCLGCVYSELAIDFHPCASCENFSKYIGEISGEQTDCPWK